jgi:hypothetical protein
MKDTTFKVIAVLILAGGGYFLYTRILKNKNSDDVSVILMSGNASNRALLLTFEPEFLSSWANAVKNSESTFEYKGKSYNTKGGKSIK